MKNRVIIVDDSLYMQSIIKATLEEGGFEVIGTSQEGKHALSLIEELQPDIVTLDNIMPNMSGLEVLSEIKNRNLTCEVVMVSAVGQTSMKNKALKEGAKGYITKPFKVDQLLEVFGELRCEEM